MGEEQVRVHEPHEAPRPRATPHADGSEGTASEARPRPEGMLYCNPSEGLLEVMWLIGEPETH